MTRTFILLVLLAGCTPAPQPQQLAVDTCELKEYLQECETELATPEETVSCQRRAHQEAIRLLAGIPAECRPTPVSQRSSP